LANEEKVHGLEFLARKKYSDFRTYKTAYKTVTLKIWKMKKLNNCTHFFQQNGFTSPLQM